MTKDEQPSDLFVPAILAHSLFSLSIRVLGNDNIGQTYCQQ